MLEAGTAELEMQASLQRVHEALTILVTLGAT